MTQEMPEKYESPKQISLVLCKVYGLCVSEWYIRAIRDESISKNENLFAAGLARPSEVYSWIKGHPGFSARESMRRLRNNAPGCTTL